MIFRHVLLALLLAVCFALPAHAQFTVTQQTTATSTSGATLVTSAFSPAANTVTYVLIFEELGPGNNPCGFTLTDSASNSYNFPNTVLVGSPKAGCFSSYYFYYSSAPGSITLTYTKGTSANEVAMTVVTIAGTNGTYDSSNATSSNGTGASPSVSASPPNGELGLGSIGWIGTNTFTQSSTFATPPNSVTVGSGATTATINAGNQVVTGGVSTYNGSITSGTQWGMLLDFFEAGSVSSPTCTLGLLHAGPC